MLFNEKIKIHDKSFELMIPDTKIEKIISRVASELNKDYEDKFVNIIVVLKGSFIFAADLLRKLNFKFNIFFITAESYGKYMTSSGDVHLSGFDVNIKNKDLLIVEDIIDTGFTAQKLFNHFLSLGASTIEFVSLLSKTEMRKVEIDVKYVGEHIPSKFVIGYGMDYDELGRNLKDIYVLSD